MEEPNQENFSHLTRREKRESLKQNKDNKRVINVRKKED